MSQQDVLESFSRQPFLKSIGATLQHVGDGEVTLAMPHRADLVQQSGTLHAGVTAAIADTAAGYAALSTMPDGANVVSVEFKLNLLAPAAGVLFVAKGRVVRAGRTLTVASADVFADDALVATLLATMMRR